MEGAFETTVAAPQPTTPPPAVWLRALRSGLGLAGAIGIAVIAAWSVRSPTAPPSLVRSVISAEPLLVSSNDVDVAISPDGRHVAISSDQGLQMRSLGQLESVSLGPGNKPFFSPDGEWVGVQNGRALRRVRVVDGSAFLICEIPGGAFLDGGSWGPDDMIVFSSSGNSGLWRVSQKGRARAVDHP